jgi:hypothetical protein
MPYETDAEVPKYVPENKRGQWREVWNVFTSAHSLRAAEQNACIQANEVVSLHTKHRSGALPLIGSDLGIATQTARRT